MYIKEWLNTNKYRAYPFKYSIFESKVVLDAIFHVSTQYTLPLIVKEVTTTENLFTLLIKDFDDKFVGIFTSLDSSIVEMKPAAKECTGKLIIDLECLKFNPSKRTTNIPIEISTVFLSYPYILENLKIHRFRNPSYNLTGDITFQENYKVIPINADTDKVIISCPQTFTPKCEQQFPILTINNVTPDTNGVIKLDTLNPHITIEYIDNKRILLKSDLNPQDFDKRSLTDAEGPIGPQGPPGMDGADGVNIPIDPIPINPLKYYGGGYYYDNGNFLTKNMDGKLVTKNDTIFCAFSDKWWRLGLPEENTNQYFCQTLEYPATCVCTVDNTLISSPGLIFVADASGGIKQIQCLNNYTKNRVVVTNTIKSITCKNDCTQFLEMAILTDNQIGILKAPNLGDDTFIFNFSFTPIINAINVKYINDKLYVLMTSGRYKIWDEVDIQLSDPRNINDTDGTWLIGDSGLLYKIPATNFSSIFNTNENLKSIDTNGSYTVVVGDNGAIYKYKDSKWYRIPSPNIKQWKSVKVDRECGAWIFGGF